MARIVFAWELGAGMGHVRYLAELAGHLARTGHDVSCIMRSVPAADREMARHGVRVLQAPLLPNPKLPAELTVNFAEILIVAGFLQRAALAGVIRSWKFLLELLRPDVLIANHAPSALIAARGFPVRVVHLGTGFAVPPRVAPMPSLIPWLEVDDERLLKSEELVVSAINHALDEVGEVPVGHLAEILRCDQEVLTTFPELDHYPTRPATQYWGPVISEAKGRAPDWPPAGKRQKRIFCYIKRSHPFFVNILQALNSIEAVKLVYAAGVQSDQVRQFSGEKLAFSPVPVDLETVCRESDAVLCHGGHGTISTALLQGTPLVLIPEHRHLEQMINAHNVCRIDAGGAVQAESKEASEAMIRGVVEMVLGDQGATEAAEKFAAEHADFEPRSQAGEIAALCAGLAGG